MMMTTMAAQSRHHAECQVNAMVSNLACLERQVKAHFCTEILPQCSAAARGRVLEAMGLFNSLPRPSLPPPLPLSPIPEEPQQQQQQRRLSLLRKIVRIFRRRSDSTASRLKEIAASRPKVRRLSPVPVHPGDVSMHALMSLYRAVRNPRDAETIMVGGWAKTHEDYADDEPPPNPPHTLVEFCRLMEVWMAAERYFCEERARLVCEALREAGFIQDLE